MEEILDGLYRWTVKHPRIGVEVGCHFVASSETAIDPLLPEEGIEWFDAKGVRRIVLSNRHHLRDAGRLATRFGCPILCHDSGLHEFFEGPAVEGFSFGDRLAEGITALEMDAICPEDTVLRIDAGEGALLFADSLINYDGLGFVPDNLLGEDPGAVKRKIRARCAALLHEEEEFEHLLFAHGEPLLSGGCEALQAIATG